MNQLHNIYHLILSTAKHVRTVLLCTPLPLWDLIFTLYFFVFLRCINKLLTNIVQTNTMTGVVDIFFNVSCRKDTCELSFCWNPGIHQDFTCWSIPTGDFSSLVHCFKGSNGSPTIYRTQLEKLVNIRFKETREFYGNVASVSCGVDAEWINWPWVPRALNLKKNFFNISTPSGNSKSLWISPSLAETSCIQLVG
jgi:hypothetical protein